MESFAGQCSLPRVWHFVQLPHGLLCVDGFFRYTLVCVPALHTLDEELKVLILFNEFQSKVGGFRESIGEPFISVKACVRALVMAS